MQINLTFKTELRVRYAETDQMGYCYYGNYAQYFEIGRVEALRSFGVSYKELEAAGVMLPVSEMNVKYIRPALYDDLLSVKTTITELSGARLMFEYKIFNEANKLLVEASTTLVFVSKETMRPIQAPKLFMDCLEKI